MLIKVLLGHGGPLWAHNALGPLAQQMGSRCERGASVHCNRTQPCGLSQDLGAEVCVFMFVYVHEFISVYNCVRV